MHTIVKWSPDTMFLLGSIGKFIQDSALSSHTEGKKDNCHTDIIYRVETRESMRGEQPRNYALTQNSATTNTGDPLACGQQKTPYCTGSPMLAQSMHRCRCTNTHSKMQGFTGPSASQKTATKENKRSLLLTLLNYI